jgi:hypothetical protein
MMEGLLKPQRQGSDALGGGRKVRLPDDLA